MTLTFPEAPVDGQEYVVIPVVLSSTSTKNMLSVYPDALHTIQPRSGVTAAATLSLGTVVGVSATFIWSTLRSTWYQIA